MPLATGAQTWLSWVQETNWGTTPATPSMVSLPVSTAKIARTMGERDSKVIRSDRQVTAHYGGERLARLDVTFPAMMAHFLPLYRNAFMQASGASLALGTTPQYQTFELGHPDIGQYEIIRGAMARSLTFSMGGYDHLRVAMEFVGRSYSLASASLGANPTPVNTDYTPVPTSAASMTWNDGSVRTLRLTGFEIKLDNGLEPLFLVNATSGAPSGIVEGRARVTGSFTVPFEDSNAAAAFLNETQCSFEMSFNSSALTIIVDYLKFTSWEPPVQGDGVVLQKLNWQARVLTLEEV